MCCMQHCAHARLVHVPAVIPPPLPTGPYWPDLCVSYLCVCLCPVLVSSCQAKRVSIIAIRQCLPHVALGFVTAYCVKTQRLLHAALPPPPCVPTNATHTTQPSLAATVTSTQQNTHSRTAEPPKPTTNPFSQRLHSMRGCYVVDAARVCAAFPVPFRRAWAVDTRRSRARAYRPPGPDPNVPQQPH